VSQTVLAKPYLLFIGSAQSKGFAKTAFGLKDWASEDCVGEFALPDAAVTTGLPRMSITEAKAAGAQSLLVGIAARGGVLEPGWVDIFTEALEAGLDVVSGLHGRLNDIPELAAAAAKAGRRIVDVRKPAPNLPIATGAKRTGKRALTVGVDCAVGKKYTALALAKAFQARGLSADFRATGQTGIMISGSGVPIDAVVSDFVAGAAEILSPDAAADHWDVVEGQGSLFHPSYAAVTLGLLHGSQPDVMILCGDVSRDRLLGLEEYPVPSLEEAIPAYESAARLTNKKAKVVAASFNTSSLNDADAQARLAEISKRIGLPCCDPIRGFGLDAVVDACLA
jgi:uncharacterized NAD-dependent epimerase/dehydratase family protein